MTRNKIHLKVNKCFLIAVDQDNHDVWLRVAGPLRPVRLNFSTYFTTSSKPNSQLRIKFSGSV